MTVSKAEYKEIKEFIHDMKGRSNSKKKMDLGRFPLFHKAIGSVQNHHKQEKLSKKFQKLAKQGIGQSLTRIEKKSNKIKKSNVALVQMLAESILVINKEKTRDGFQKRLQTLADKVLILPEKQKISSNTSVSLPTFIDEVRPLVGSEMTMQDLANEYSQGVEKRGLERLDAFFKMRRVAGDGHCLFRAVFTSLLYFLKTASQEVKEMVLGQIARSVMDLRDVNHALEAKHKEVVGAIDAKQPLEAILTDRKTSDLLVSFLRDLVSAHHFVYGDEVFYSEAELYSKNKEQYLKDMMSMDKRELGGEPEILALNKLLGIEIIVLHTVEVGEGKKDPAAYVQKAVESQAIPVFLIFRPGHYDYAFLA